MTTSIYRSLLNGINANNKVNRWSLELASITTHLNGYQVPATRQLTASHDWVYIKDTPATSTGSINMLVTSAPDGPTTCTHSKTCNPTDAIPPTDLQTTSNTDKVNHLHLSQKLTRTLSH